MNHQTPFAFKLIAIVLSMAFLSSCNKAYINSQAIVYPEAKEIGSMEKDERFFVD